MKSTSQQRRVDVAMIRAFISTYDAHDESDREIALAIRTRLQSELYRREREHYPEWIDIGGEGA